MQALTVSIGPLGITFFINTLLRPDLDSSIKNLTPLDSDYYPPDMPNPPDKYIVGHRDIHIRLTDGKFVDYAPGYESYEQGKGTESGQFILPYADSKFSAKYHWKETYEQQQTDSNGTPINEWFDREYECDYEPGVNGLTAPVTMTLQFDASLDSYNIMVRTSADIADFDVNLPKNTVLRGSSCDFDETAIQTAGENFAKVGFSAQLQNALPAQFKSIAASGKLTDDIVYEFDLGESGITYPNDNGITIGVTGKVSYKGEYYPGTPPAALPLPAVPSSNYLCMYVSAYEIDALHWAYWRAGKLAVTVTPDYLEEMTGNSNPLYTDNYSWLSENYPSTALIAQVAPKEAPTTCFQTVYSFTPSVMAQLSQQLPADVYNIVNNHCRGKTYVSQADLEKILAKYGVDSSWWPTIEAAAKAMGMVVSQDLRFTVTLQTDDPDDKKPNVVFDVNRTDVLYPTGLGTTKDTGAQTLQFQFTAYSYHGTFVSTTIPDYEDYAAADFDYLWRGAGEPGYDTVLKAMGQTGVPLPIMADFQFVFAQATLSVQDGYVSITSDVVLKPHS